MLDEYYDLQKTISELIQENEKDTENINKNLELSLFEIEKPNREINYLNQYISNIKKNLIKRGYLDYINKENYQILNDIRSEILIKELNYIISLDFDELEKNFLMNENIIFHHILKKILENEYFIFLVNYDFLENGMKINYNNIREIYYNTNQKKISDEEIRFQIENIKIITQEEIDYIEEIYKIYEIYNRKNKDYLSDINNLIDKVNNSEVLNTKINFDEILKHKHDFFIEGVKNNKIQLEGIIAEFVYKNEIQEFLDAKNNIIKKVNLKKQEINKLKNKFLNEDYKSKYLELQEYNYSIRELSNSYLSNFKENE